MKITNLINLTEAVIELDTVNFKSVLFQDFLKDNSIKAKVIDNKGPSGWPVIEYSGDKKSLEKLIHNFFGDDDLKDYIEERINVNLKLSRIYSKKDGTSAHLLHHDDGSFQVEFFNKNNKPTGSLDLKFKNSNAATKWLESNGWTLEDLYENSKK
jgi:hypothetical protein